MAPSTQKQWTVEGNTGFDSLKYKSDAPIPKLGENDVLVKCTLLTNALQPRPNLPQAH